MPMMLTLVSTSVHCLCSRSQKYCLPRARGSKIEVVRPNLEVIFKLEIICTCMYVGIALLVQSTTSMQGMLLLGSLGACPPRKILKITCSEIASEGNFDDKQVHKS